MLFIAASVDIAQVCIRIGWVPVHAYLGEVSRHVVAVVNTEVCPVPVHGSPSFNHHDYRSDQLT